MNALRRAVHHHICSHVNDLAFHQEMLFYPVYAFFSSLLCSAHTNAGNQGRHDGLTFQFQYSVESNIQSSRHQVKWLLTSKAASESALFTSGVLAAPACVALDPNAMADSHTLSFSAFYGGFTGGLSERERYLGHCRDPWCGERKYGANYGTSACPPLQCVLIIMLLRTRCPSAEDACLTN